MRHSASIVADQSDYSIYSLLAGVNYLYGVHDPNETTAAGEDNRSGKLYSSQNSYTLCLSSFCCGEAWPHPDTEQEVVPLMYFLDILETIAVHWPTWQGGQSCHQ